MRTQLIVACLVITASAAAAPLYTKAPSSLHLPDVVAAERAWQRAAHETDTLAAAAAWYEAGTAWDKAVGTGGREAAYAAVLAWKNAAAVATQSAIEPDDAKLYAALGVYAPFTTGDEAAGLAVLGASLLRKHGHLDEAVPLLERIVTASPGASSSEYAALLLLEGLEQGQRFTELVEWTAKLRAMPTLTANRPALVATLDGLDVQISRTEAEQLARAGDFARCAQTYVDAYHAHPSADAIDEVVYDAGICFERARARDAAIGMYREVWTKFPHSRFVTLAHDRASRL